MPTILTQKQINKEAKRQYKTTNPESVQTALQTKVLRQYCYSLQEWRNLRFSYFAQHPLDELSLLSDTVEAAEDIHHLISPFQAGKNLQEIITLLLDADNLIALCKRHHGYIHGHPEQLTEAQKEYLQKRINAVREKYGWRF